MPDQLSEPHRHKGMGKRGNVAVSGDMEGVSATPAPCGACKFLRRKCAIGCIFSQHFGSDQGAARFAAVHKVFGASNVSKLLSRIPMNRRHDAVLTISYEAQARLSDPVYGCVSTILALQQQLATLQAELAMVQSQVVNSRMAVAKALQSSQQQEQPNDGFEVMQLPHHSHPAYSNNSQASNNYLNMNTAYKAPTTYDFAAVSAETCIAPSSRSFELLQLSRSSDEDDRDEEISRNHLAFAKHLLHSR